MTETDHKLRGARSHQAVGGFLLLVLAVVLQAVVPSGSAYWPYIFGALYLAIAVLAVRIASKNFKELRRGFSIRASFLSLAALIVFALSSLLIAFFLWPQSVVPWLSGK